MKLRKKMKKKLWSVAITAIFLLNTLSYPAYGMKTLAGASRVDNPKDPEDKGLAEHVKRAYRATKSPQEILGEIIELNKRRDFFREGLAIFKEEEEALEKEEEIVLVTADGIGVEIEAYVEIARFAHSVVREMNNDRLFRIRMGEEFCQEFSVLEKQMPTTWVTGDGRISLRAFFNTIFGVPSSTLSDKKQREIRKIFIQMRELIEQHLAKTEVEIAALEEPDTILVAAEPEPVDKSASIAKFEEWLDSAFRGTIPTTRIKNEIIGAVIPEQRENRLKKLFAGIKSEEDLETARSIARMIILHFAEAEKEKEYDDTTDADFEKILLMFQQTAEEAGIGFNVDTADNLRVHLEFLASYCEPLVRISTDKLANIAQTEQIAGTMKQLYIDARLLFDKQGNLQVVGLENIFAKLNDLLSEEISEADRHIKIVVPRDAGDMWATLKKFGERYDFLEIVHESDAIKFLSENVYRAENWQNFTALVSEKEYNRMMDDENDGTEFWPSFVSYSRLIKIEKPNSAEKEISLILAAVVFGLDLLSDGKIDNAEQLLREHYQGKIITEAEVDKIVRALQWDGVKKFPAVKPIEKDFFENYQRQLDKEQEAFKEV